MNNITLNDIAGYEIEKQEAVKEPGIKEFIMKG